METKICSRIHRINYLNAELDALYHHASLKLGLTDSASIVLYTIYDNGEDCLLSDIYKQSGVSKQTVNSAIRNLEKKHIIYLEQHSGRAKKVVLTDAGKEYVQKTTARLFDAEAAAFGLGRKKKSTLISDLWKSISIRSVSKLKSYNNAAYHSCRRQVVGRIYDITNHRCHKRF